MFSAVLRTGVCKGWVLPSRYPGVHAIAKGTCVTSSLASIQYHPMITSSVMMSYCMEHTSFQKALRYMPLAITQLSLQTYTVIGRKRFVGIPLADVLATIKIHPSTMTIGNVHIFMHVILCLLETRWGTTTSCNHPHANRFPSSKPGTPSTRAVFGKR